MKKAIIILGFLVSSSAAWADNGYFIFTSPAHSIWDSISQSPQFDNNLDVAFLWAPSGDTPLVSGLFASTPTNGATEYDYAAAWNDILTDPNFQLAEFNNVVCVGVTFSNGSSFYNSGQEFVVDGTTGNVTYSIYQIAWYTAGGLYQTPSQAAAVGEAVGWSPVFSYQPAGTPPIGGVPHAMTPSPFGVGSYVIPEPTTFALAGLGGISMLFLRRRKS